MLHAVVIYPHIQDQLLESLRRQHDPSVDSISPHVTVMFPVPRTVKLDALLSHTDGVARSARPFEVTFDGFQTSPDHWLFLTQERGANDCRELHAKLYAGEFASYRREDIEYVPHLALGLFLRDGIDYDPRTPRPEHLDVDRHEKTRLEAQPLLNLPSTTITSLHVIAIPETLMQWFEGGGGSYPTNQRVQLVKEFALGPGRA